MITLETSPRGGNYSHWVHTIWKRRYPDFWHILLKHSLSKETAIHSHLAPQKISQPCISLCRPSLFFLSNFNIWFFFFIPSRCLAYLCMYLFMHCVICSRKSSINTNTGDVYENSKFVMLILPFQSASAPLFTRNRGVWSHDPGQGNKSQMNYHCLVVMLVMYLVHFRLATRDISYQSPSGLNLFNCPKCFSLKNFSAFHIHFSEHCPVGKMTK